jgi:hypothetical protein
VDKNVARSVKRSMQHARECVSTVIKHFKLKIPPLKMKFEIGQVYKKEMLLELLTALDLTIF